MMIEYSTKIIRIGVLWRSAPKGRTDIVSYTKSACVTSDWKLRYGRLFSEHRCMQQREERQILEMHAKNCGCRLIINPYLTYKIYGREARKTRIRNLIEFLKSMESIDEKVKVAISKPKSKEHYLTIVGDWFAAESVSSTMGEGIRQTIFTPPCPKCA